MNEPDDLLRLASDAPPSALRARLREQTSRVVRRVNVYRRLKRAAGLAACFAAGGLTAWLVQPRPEVEIVFVDRPVAAKPPEPPQLPKSPHQLELAAEQADGVESAKLFLEAGRLYGGGFNDWDAALRCYRNALDLDPTLAENSDPTTDDWLLAKLKTDWRDRDANP